MRMAAPCLTRLVTGISPRRSGFNYKPVHVVDEEAKSFSPSTSVYPVSNDPRLLHTHSTMTVDGGRDHLEELGTDGRILKYIFKKIGWEDVDRTNLTQNRDNGKIS